MRIRKTASGITAAIMLATVVCSPLCDNLPLASGGSGDPDWGYQCV